MLRRIARTIFARFLRNDPGDLVADAAEASRVGDRERAAVICERALALDPLSPRFRYGSGRLRFFTRQFDAAIEQYRKTLELDSNFPLAHEELGYAYEKKGM